MVMYMNTYKLKKGASVPDFKQAVERLLKEIFANHKGVISFKLLSEDDGWADCIIWDSTENYNAFMEAAQSKPTEAALTFYSFLNMSSCVSRVYTVEMDV